MQSHPITLGAINFRAQDPVALAAFWASVIGATPSFGGDTVYLPAVDRDGFAMFFQPMALPRPERQTIHVDLTVPWGSRQEEVERIVGLGATHRWDVLNEVPHVQWTTMSDPEGNLFCVAEHPPATPSS